MEHALAVLDCKDSKRGILERLERRIGESESKEDEDTEGGDTEGGDTEGDDLPEPWSYLAREVYPPLIRHPCLLDPEFELNKEPIDAVMEPPTRLDALIDAEEGEKLESMDIYNAKRHERMLWRLVGKEDESESESESGTEEEDTTEPRRGGRLNWMFRRAGGAIKSEPFVNTSDDSDSE